MQPFQPETKSLYQVGVQAESSAQHTMNLESNPALRLDGGLHSAGEVANARQFFTPGADTQALSSHVALPGLEHSTSAALHAASQTISPLLQLIMRLPTHVSIFGSFLEAIQNFFLPHTDVLTQLANIHATGLSHFSTGLSSLVSHHAADWSIMPTHANIFQTSAFDTSNMTSAHLHLSPSEALKHSMNVSAGADLQHPQFEKLAGPQTADLGVSNASNVAASGDALAGPGISTQAITPHLAPAERIFSGKYFEMPTGSQINSGTNILANSQNLASNSLAGNSSVANNNVIASASITPSPSLSQAPTTNSGLDAAPIEGLHAKELSFANFSASHHSVHSIASSNHVLSHNPVAKQSIAQAKTSTTHSASQPMPTDNVYTVKSGDTLWRIAQDQLGDGSRWQDIYNLNTNTLGSNPDLIHSGTDINLPASDQNTLPDASQDGSIMASQSAPGHYTVKAGDDLWQISQNLLGDGHHWSNLYNANSDVIGANPNMILPGQKFDLPGIATNSHIAAAIPVHSAGVHAVSNLHHVMPKSVQHIEPVQTTVASNINPVHSSIHIQSPHAPHVESAHSALASNAPVTHENAIAHNSHPQISMHTNINANNGLSIESAHDQLLSGAGSAQASGVSTSGVSQNSVISKAANNLVAGKSKSVVSFSLAPDLSFLQIKK